MHRRNFLAAAVVAPAAAQVTPSTTLLKPRALKPGDTVALITPSTYVSNPESILKAQRLAELLGLKPKLGKYVGRRAGYLGGTIDERVEDLQWAFSDPSVQGVFCVRGGYGAAMLLDKIDWSVIRRNPKVFLGYSDITALHLGMVQSAGMVSFHGPTMLSSVSDYTFEHLKKAIFSTEPLGVLSNPAEPSPLRSKHFLRTLRPGSGRGPLLGGNLTLISTTMGTPWEIKTDGRVLFLEDVDEQPYSMDRMLTQLRLAGKFKNIKGLLLGECADCRPKDYKPSFESTFSLPEVYDAVLQPVTAPTVSGLTIGHTEDQLTLPLGVMSSLDADKGTLTLEESALTK